MIKLLICLILGFVAGYFTKGYRFIKFKNILMPVSILVLLFFMGVGIGKDPNLSQKIVSFGINAVIIAICSILFSMFFVFIFMRIFKK